MNSIKDTDFEHTGPGRPAGHLLRQRWQPVYAADDLEPGRAVPLKILHEELTLYRRRRRRRPRHRRPLRASRCAVVGRHGGRRRVRCRYHGWQYDETGQCVDQPAEPKSFADEGADRELPGRGVFRLDLGVPR